MSTDAQGRLNDAIWKISQMGPEQYPSEAPREEVAASAYGGRLYSKESRSGGAGPLSEERAHIAQEIQTILSNIAAGPTDISIAASLRQLGDHLHRTGFFSDPKIKKAFAQAHAKVATAPSTVGVWKDSETGSETSMTMQRLPLAAAAVDPGIDREKVMAANRAIQDRSFQLDCREFEELADPIRFDEQKVQEHLATLHGNQLEAETLLHKEAQILTYDQLKRGIVACTEELSSQLGDRDYTVVYKRTSSNRWIAEMAVPLMKKTPTHEWDVTPFRDREPGDRLPGRCLVFFDDASYSGYQIMYFLKKAIAAKDPADRPVDVYFVIPFISSNALNQMKLSLGEEFKSKNINLHVITTEVPIKTLQEAFASNPELIPYVSPDPRVSEGHCVTFMQWCLPDGVSVPLNIYQISNEDLMVLGQDRPYKLDRY